MKLESVGLLISIRPINERDSIAHVFTRDFGVVSGMMRGAVVAKKNKPLVGQVGLATWNARVDSQLGVFHWDVERNLGAMLMCQPQMLMAMNSAFALLDALLPEREENNLLYDETIDLLMSMASGGGMQAYLQWEINLLRDVGYALDLSRCSGCGCSDGLQYLSPRTGRAVCVECAQPYLNKLFKLPINMNTTLRFLEGVCMQQGIDVPMARRILK
ncbi:MAG: DNA repair protein RecO [Alphaproteobacteria bacterium]|nr:DNA repair protein RecO [Alphaproteobacteria bacterium]